MMYAISRSQTDDGAMAPMVSDETGDVKAVAGEQPATVAMRLPASDFCSRTVSPRDELSGVEKRKPGFVPFEEMSHLVSYTDSKAQKANQYITEDAQASLKTLNQNLEWLDLLNPDEKPQTLDLGDMSRVNGAKYGKHKSHQRGTSIDMRPPTQTYTHGAVGDFRYNKNYSLEKTQVLVDLLKSDPNVKTIYFNDGRIDGVRHAKGHDNHLHVELKK